MSRLKWIIKLYIASSGLPVTSMCIFHKDKLITWNADTGEVVSKSSLINGIQILLDE